MYREISADLKNNAECKLNEVTSRIENDIIQVRQWMTQQPHLDFEIDDQLILSFLRCCKFSLQRTKEKIDSHYAARSVVPEMFGNRDPLQPKMQHLLRTCLSLPLPNLDPDDGSRIILIDYSSNLDPNFCSLPDQDKLNYMILDILLMEDDYAIINGVKLVVHCKDFNLRFLPDVTLPYIRKHAYSIEKGFPFRFQGVCVVNCHAPFVFAYNLFNTFASSKITQRMSMFSETDVPGLCKRSPHLLPKEMGGNNGSIEELKVIWKNKIESYKEWFLAEDTKKSDESLRRGPPKTSADELGIEGSFRKLDID